MDYSDLKWFAWFQIIKDYIQGGDTFPTRKNEFFECRTQYLLNLYLNKYILHIIERILFAQFIGLLKNNNCTKYWDNLMNIQ